MDKKLFMRRVAILLALVVGILQMQIGGAVTATDYDFAASVADVRGDLLGGGSATTDGSADVSGTVSATAGASSAQPAGSYNFAPAFCLDAETCTPAFGVGGNSAKRDSFVRETISGLVTGTYNATITVAVSSLNVPAPVGSGFNNGTTRVTTGRSYSHVQLGASLVGADSLGNSIGTPTATFKSKDGGGINSLAVGTNTLTLSITLPSPGSVTIEVHLIAEAWAAGNNSSASASCIADVSSIELA